MNTKLKIGFGIFAFFIIGIVLFLLGYTQAANNQVRNDLVFQVGLKCGTIYSDDKIKVEGLGLGINENLSVARGQCQELINLYNVNISQYGLTYYG